MMPPPPTRLAAHLLAGLVSASLSLGLTACDKDTKALGEACTDNAQCKDPADQCLTIGTKSRCSLACAKEDPCPDEYVCAVTNPKQMDRGMCLPQSEIGPNVVTIGRKGKGVRAKSKSK